MKKDNHVHILFRYGVITMLILLFSGMIGYKLFSTTVIDATHWNEKARRQLEKVDTILPERGDILSDKGELLATNLRYYTVRIDFRCDNFKQNQYLASIDALADSMGKHFPIRTRDEWRKRLEKPLKTEKAKRPRAWPLVGNISFLDLQKIKSFPFFNIGNPNKTGMTVESVLRRSNPYGAMARRSVGGVGQTRECKEVHGIYGLEKALDSLLYGKPGLSKKIALTKDIVNWTDVPPTPGYNVRTTIDIQLQDIVENELNRVLDSCSADWGCAVLMDVKTGDIKAISNLERSKNGNGYIEALNYAVVGFEPGSVVKPISMMIALEDGFVDNLEEVIPIGQSWAYAGGRPITDSHYNGSLRVREVIEQSSNIGMARIDEVDYKGVKIVPLQFLKAVLPNPQDLGENYHGETSIGCRISGKAKDGEPLTYYIYNNCSHEEAYKETGAQAVSYTTGVPAMVGAYMFLTGKWVKPGVHNVEEFDPDPFLEKLAKSGLPWHVIVDGDLEL